jgi:Na+-translocating ferredoxin:NAD+ oxidoreductase RnfD subunit
MVIISPFLINFSSGIIANGMDKLSKKRSKIMPQTRVSKFLPMSRQMKALNRSLLLLVLAGTIIFGFQVLFAAIIAVSTSLILEIIFGYFREKKIDEGWLYNPLVFVLLIPPSLPIWMIAVGAAVSSFFGKLVFGGYPKYVFNPAVVGIIFLMISFPQYMNTQWLDPVTQTIGQRTPIIVLNNPNLVFTEIYPLINLFTGMTPGLIGEVSRGLIIFLGFILIITKVIDWRAPVTFLVSLFAMTYLGHFLGIAKFPDPYFAMIVGAALFAAVFLVSDKPTLAVTKLGRFVYGFLFAFFTIIIRVWAAWPEGVIFATIITNALSPLIDALVSRKPIATLITAEVK